MTIAYVGLGGNVGDVPARIRAAADAIRGWVEVDEVALSSLIRSAAVGPVTDQPDFVNAVAQVRVDDAVSPRSFLERLLALETELGRDRADAVDKGPRAIDLDLLVFGDMVDARDPRCIVPHPHLAERAFALIPLAELAGEEFEIPGTGTTMAELLARDDVAAQQIWSLS